MNVTLVPRSFENRHSDFFHSLDNEILIELANRPYVKSYQEEEYISEADDTCRELLLLIEGTVEIRVKRADQTEIISNLLSGKVLDELEVLTHTNQTGTITAKASPTRVLAIPVDTFDDLMDRDRHLAIKVLELESLRIKGLLGIGLWTKMKRKRDKRKGRRDNDSFNHKTKHHPRTYYANKYYRE